MRVIYISSCITPNIPLNIENVKRLNAAMNEVTNTPMLWNPWGYEYNEEGRLTKIAYLVGNRGQEYRASTDNPSQWNSLDVALKQYKPGEFAGIGMLARAPFVALDIDHCFDEATGAFTDMAQTIMDRFPGAYTELSPSGTGLRIIVYDPTFKRDLNEYYEKHNGLEVYAAGSTHWVSVTGCSLRNVRPFENYAETVKAVMDEYMKRTPKATPKARDVQPVRLSLSNSELLDKARTAKNGDKFRRLFDLGDISDYPSRSEADLALCSLLAYWTAGNAGRMEDLFNASALNREKWADRPDYRKSTIEKAIAGCSEFYNPTKARSMKRTTPAEDFGDLEEQETVPPTVEASTPTVTDTYTAQGVRKEVKPPPVRELDLIDAATLSVTEMPELVYYVADMLPQGCGLLVAPPKMGKSFLALQLSTCVASGRPFLDHFTAQAGVVYVSLEDSRRRLKKRLAKQLGDSPKPDNLFLTTEAPTLDDGLIQSLESMLNVHPDIGLVIIDTLQYVRGNKKRDQNEYQYDAETIKPLKRLADLHGICVLIVHHTRKMNEPGNPFNQISGTNGLFGTVDFSWIIQKEGFGELKGTIFTSGRDIEYQEIAFEVDKSKMWYSYVGDAMQIRKDQELHDYKADPVFSGIRQLLLESENHRIKFKAQELLEAIERVNGEKLDTSARNLVAKLQRNGNLYHLSQDKIRYTTEEDSGRKGKWHIFESMPAHTDDGEETAEEMEPPF